MKYKQVYLLCYPRTASRYFTAVLESKIGKRNVFKTHNRDINAKGELIVGLIRNPVDQFSSALAQGAEFNENFFLEGEELIKEIKKHLGIQKGTYVRTMKSIMERSAIIFDYEFFTSSPETAAVRVLDEMELSDGGFPLEIPETQVDEIMKYMKSSKESKTYDLVRSIVEQTDLSEQIEIYNKALSLCYKG